jgi:uncharacterized membrane protein YGL010W
MFAIKNVARFAILTPIVVILLTIGWYQQAIDHVNVPDNTLPIDHLEDSYIIAGYFINW